MQLPDLCYTNEAPEVLKCSSASPKWRSGRSISTNLHHFYVLECTNPVNHFFTIEVCRQNMPPNISTFLPSCTHPPTHTHTHTHTPTHTHTHAHTYTHTLTHTYTHTLHFLRWSFEKMSSLACYQSFMHTKMNGLSLIRKTAQEIPRVCLSQDFSITISGGTTDIDWL